MTADLAAAYARIAALEATVEDLTRSMLALQAERDALRAEIAARDAAVDLDELPFCEEPASD